jgi:peptide deformylase
MYQVLTTPHKFLRHTAKPVKKFDDKLKDQLDEMVITLKRATNPEGVGLASTQVHLDLRAFIVILSGRPEIFINPEIIATSPAMMSEVYKKSKDRWLEGCLSIPHYWGFVDRPYWVDIKYITLNPESQFVETTRRFTGIESTYTQHENDHLNGVLFTDHILSQGGTLYKDSPTGLIAVDAV